MRIELNRLTRRESSGLCAQITATLLLATLPVTAASTTSYTSTGWVIGVPVPGIWFTNALG